MGFLAASSKQEDPWTLDENDLQVLEAEPVESEVGKKRRLREEALYCFEQQMPLMKAPSENTVCIVCHTNMEVNDKYYKVRFLDPYMRL